MVFKKIGVVKTAILIRIQKIFFYKLLKQMFTFKKITLYIISSLYKELLRFFFFDSFHSSENKNNVNLI